MTAEEQKQEILNKMGQDFGTLFYSLAGEVIWLTFKWTEFEELYGKSKERVQLMNQAAPFFFFVVQKVLWQDLLLGIATITDPPKSRGKQNVTITAVPTYVSDQKFKGEISKLIDEILSDAQFCRQRRNKIFAHKDLELASGKEDAQPLRPSNRRQLRTTLKKIQTLINKLELKYLGRETWFELMFEHGGGGRGAIFLLRRIEDGLKYDKEQYEKKKQEYGLKG